MMFIFNKNIFCKKKVVGDLNQYRDAKRWQTHMAE